METYPTIKLQDPKHLDSCQKIFEALSNDDLEEAKKNCQLISAQLQAELGVIADKYGEALFQVDEVERDDSFVEASFTCGGDGLELLAELIYVFGPHVKNASGTISHDEDSFDDEDEDTELAYESGKVFIGEEELEGYFSEINEARS